MLTQDGHTVTTKRLWWPAAPGRIVRIPSAVRDTINHNGGPVTIGVRQ